MRLLLITVFAATLLLSGCGGDADTGGGAAAGDGAAEVTTIGGNPGQRAPEFSLPNLAGGDLSLSSLRGKAVLIDFWDTWCGPCRRAMPHLQELSETYADDLVIVGIAMGRQGEAAVRKYVAGAGLSFEIVLFNGDAALLQRFGGITGLPTTFLVDAAGVVRYKWIGGKPKGAYEQAVREVIGT